MPKVALVTREERMRCLHMSQVFFIIVEDGKAFDTRRETFNGRRSRTRERRETCVVGHDEKKKTISKHYH